ncbi:pseudouridine synthase [Flavitalea antarctica]
MPIYYSIYKPFQVLSQFSVEGSKQTLKDIYQFPTDVYPVGRLDYDSEGLLIITNDKSLNHKLLNPAFGHEREYWVQVEGQINAEALEQLRAGVDISIEGGRYHTAPCMAMVFTVTPPVAERNPPIRFRKNIPTSWIRLILTEGKNRQVRKMTAAIGFPTLRLIRYRIGHITIDQLAPGQYKEWDRQQIYQLLGIK